MENNENQKYDWIKLPDTSKPFTYKCGCCGCEVINRYRQCPWCDANMKDE